MKKHDGIIIDNRDPIKGIKFKKKAKTANVGAKSLLKKYKITNVKKAVKILVVFI